MRKLTIILILLLLAGMHSYSQKKSGTVYSEHEYIELTRELWKASMEGDEARIRSYYADSVSIARNGKLVATLPNSEMAKGMSEWISQWDNLKVRDHKPAYPDALEYKEGGIWVQDWLLLTGVHKETGIILNLPIHNLYAFNEEGKIKADVSYFDNDIFEEIANSKKKKLNGKVYIHHPHIVSVRKLVNAFVANDKEEWMSYYAPKARVSSAPMAMEESIGIEELWESLTKKYHQGDLKFKVEQVGYPDCIYYEKNDMYVVYSWWKMTVKKDGKIHEYGFMLSHDFNKDGKIVREIQYYSSNHTQNF